MKVGDTVRCRDTQRIGLIVARAMPFEWGYRVLFPEGIEEQNGGWLEVINEL